MLDIEHCQGSFYQLKHWQQAFLDLSKFYGLKMVCTFNDRVKILNSNFVSVGFKIAVLIYFWLFYILN